MKFVYSAFALATAATALAHPVVCSYDLYRPAAVEAIVRHTLADENIALLGGRDILTGIPSGSMYLLQRSQVLGSMRFVQDDRAGTSELSLTDADGKTYFQMTERTFVCPPENPLGRCKLTELTTELDKLATSPAPFGQMLDPQGLLHFYKYGKEVNAGDWQGQFGETLRWLQDVTTHPHFSRAILATDPASRIYYALASDAFLAPYVDRLTFFFDGTYWVVKGVVPSDGVYGAVIDRMREAGFSNVNPEMTIDTGTALPLPPEVPFAGECYQ